MNGLLRIVFAISCALSLVATACQSNTRVPMPDALRSEGLTLSPEPNGLTIRPIGSGRIEFQLRDNQDQPVPDYPVDFSIVSDGLDAGAVQVKLSSDRCLTDPHGSAVVQVITDGFGTEVSNAVLAVQASSVGADPVVVYVRVTTDAYAVNIVPVAAEGSMARARVYFFDHTRCSQLDPTNLAAAPTRPRPDVDTDPWIFSGVSGEGSHAVVGLGLDASGALRLAGCLDLAGSSLLENQIISATLLLDRLLPIPTGTFAVASDISLSAPVPQPVAAIQTTWQEWTRCPMEPARLWLDCTVDALVTSASDPNDCVPVAGGEGSLGGILASRRGITLAASSSATNKGPTECHDRVDSNGKASLESIVDLLFSGSSGAIAGLSLAALPSEIGGLLAAVHLDSTMHITAGENTNRYRFDHELSAIGFPYATPPLSFTPTALALPMPRAEGIGATLKLGGQLSLEPHGFTLRLGTAAQYAFEANSLKRARNLPSVEALVNAVFAMAAFSEQGKVLTGCDALDAVLCDQAKQSRGCALGACKTGLSALAQKLLDSFGNLNGDGLDFFLSGSAPAVDSNGDGRADGLGTVRTTSVRSGVWVPEFRASAGSTWVTGLWSASAAP